MRNNRNFSTRQDNWRRKFWKSNVSNGHTNKIKGKWSEKKRRFILDYLVSLYYNVVIFVLNFKTSLLLVVATQVLLSVLFQTLTSAIQSLISS